MKYCQACNLPVLDADNQPVYGPIVNIQRSADYIHATCLHLLARIGAKVSL